jgi:hypothetical protein
MTLTLNKYSIAALIVGLSDLGFTTKLNGVQLELGSCYHMLELILRNQQMKNDW